ncbi:deoxyribose-phosphate aldolase [Candidatus Bipolaricaulota bacterium]|nr:deoxyribose-phosphate aldolase [Candidatus Bipolaricaulota bacterium]
MIDHTELRMDAHYGDLARACLEAAKFGFASVAVNPVHVARCAKLLAGTAIKVDAAVGFHTGAFTIENKVFETRDALDHGADEIDFVMNVAALKAGDHDYVLREMQALRKATEGHIVKVILETCLLSDNEKIKACELAVQAALDFVKTSTGFSTGGATADDIRLMKSVVKNAALVKASGGIQNAEQAQSMIKAGASRLGTSAGVKIMEQLLVATAR